MRCSQPEERERFPSPRSYHLGQSALNSWLVARCKVCVHKNASRRQKSGFAHWQISTVHSGPQAPGINPRLLGKNTIVLLNLQLTCHGFSEALVDTVKRTPELPAINAPASLSASPSMNQNIMGCHCTKMSHKSSLNSSCGAFHLGDTPATGIIINLIMCAGVDTELFKRGRKSPQERVLPYFLQKTMNSVHV